MNHESAKLSGTCLWGKHSGLLDASLPDDPAHHPRSYLKGRSRMILKRMQSRDLIPVVTQQYSKLPPLLIRCGKLPDQPHMQKANVFLLVFHLLGLV